MYYATLKKFQSGSYYIDDDFKMPPKYIDTAKTQLNPAWIEEQKLTTSTNSFGSQGAIIFIFGIDLAIDISS